MEAKTFVLHSQEIASNCIKAVKCCDVVGNWEVVIRKVSKDKTLKQLGALFGLWVTEEASRMGESPVYVHSKWKAWFLARIYFIEPHGDIQAMWVDHFSILKDGDREAFERHSKRISLSWATLKQMSAYMKAIEEHYQAEGMPLMIPDRHYKMWSKR